MPGGGRRRRADRRRGRPGRRSRRRQTVGLGAHHAAAAALHFLSTTRGSPKGRAATRVGRPGRSHRPAWRRARPLRGHRPPHDARPRPRPRSWQAPPPVPGCSTSCPSWLRPSVSVRSAGDRGVIPMGRQAEPALRQQRRAGSACRALKLAAGHRRGQEQHLARQATATALAASPAARPAAAARRSRTPGPSTPDPPSRRTGRCSPSSPAVTPFTVPTWFFPSRKSAGCVLVIV